MRTHRELAIDYLAFAEWNAADIACAEVALGPRERREGQHFTHPERRRQWLAGRWLTKKLLSDMPAVPPLGDVEILSRDTRSLGTRPRVMTASQELPLSVSLSHNTRGVLACASRERAVGADLVETGPHSDGFYRLWFHDGERRWIDKDRVHRGPLAWSIKEAVYKAMNLGEGWDPRAIEVSCVNECTEPAAISYRGRVLADVAIERIECGHQRAVIVTVPVNCRRERIEVPVALCS